MARVLPPTGVNFAVVDFFSSIFFVSVACCQIVFWSVAVFRSVSVIEFVSYIRLFLICLLTWCFYLISFICICTFVLTVQVGVTQACFKDAASDPATPLPRNAGNEFWSQLAGQRWWERQRNCTSSFSVFTVHSIMRNIRSGDVQIKIWTLSFLIRSCISIRAFLYLYKNEFKMIKLRFQSERHPTVYYAWYCEQ